MMGRKENHQGQFFYHFNLDQRVPPNHLLRGVDRFLDLSGLHEQLDDYYSHTGRPSIDPELLIRMLIVGYCYGIRSERRLCEEIEMNLAYRWFCRLSLEDDVPDHSTFSKNRHGRFRDSDILRYVFDQVVDRCIDEGLVSGDGFAVDASLVKADASRKNTRILWHDDDDWPRPSGSSRAAKEYLQALDDGTTEPMRNISITDPAAQYTSATGDRAFFAYSNNYLIDTEAGIIMDVEASRASRTEEVATTKTMIDRVEQKFGIKPNRLAGDTAYGAADMLGWLVKEKVIAPHIPVWDKSDGKKGLFGRSDFRWQAESDRYICPGGKQLIANMRKRHQQPHVTKEKTIIYRAASKDCAGCEYKAVCCPNTLGRKIHRSIHEDARDLARSLRHTTEFEKSCDERKKVEMLFGHMKRVLKLDRLRLRGRTGAHDEFLLVATAQNLRRMALWLAHDPPDESIGVPV